MNETITFRIATYNVHSCRGIDRQERPERIATVLRETGAGIIALQEVWSVYGEEHERCQVRAIAKALGMQFCFGGNRDLEGRVYGNAILSSWPIRAERHYDISWGGRERRGCLRADVSLDDITLLHVFNAHLGLLSIERRDQASRLVGEEILSNIELEGPRILLGDFNEWRRGLASQLLASQFRNIDIKFPLRRARTYPGLLPLLHLDHIYYDRVLQLKHLRAHRSRATIIASDHLPLIADFELQGSVMKSA